MKVSCRDCAQSQFGNGSKIPECVLDLSDEILGIAVKDAAHSDIDFVTVCQNTGAEQASQRRFAVLAEAQIVMAEADDEAMYDPKHYVSGTLRRRRCATRGRIVGTV